jgi:MFS family permease
VKSGRRWALLAASTLAQTASAVASNGAAFLIPTLHRHDGLTLGQAGVVAAAPTVGVTLALVAWGWFADHRGERLALLLGLGVAGAASLAAVVVHDLVAFTVLLGVAGAGAAATNSASGRVVVGWFPPERRGLAMGVRQMAQPVGVGIAAVAVAVVADSHGIHVAELVPTVACAIAIVLVAALVLDPPRPDRTTVAAPNPYRADRYLARIHGVSVLLVIPQIVVWTFALVWLVQSRHWSTAAAGAIVAVAQVFGALGRIGVGQLSDVVRSRMRPLQWVAVAACATMLLLGVTAGLGWWVAVPLIVVATMLTVADNGLAFTAVAERAGPFWSGRALGLQNTAQFIASALVPPLGGLAVTAFGYSWLFALSAVFALVAIPLVPHRDEHALS